MGLNYIQKMKLSSIIGVCILGTTSLIATEEVIPEVLSKCKVKSTEYSQCVIGAIDDLRPYFVKGVPELNIPSIDPLRVPKFLLERQHSLVAVYQAVISKYVYTGTKDFEVLNYELDLTELIMKFKIRFPVLHMDITGDANGTLFGFQLKGVGKGNVTFTNLIIDSTLSGEKYVAGGKTFLKWKADNVTASYDIFRIIVHDLFANKFQEAALSDVINYNADLLNSHIAPVVEHTLGHFILDVVNRVHAKYPYDVLYPEN